MALIHKCGSDDDTRGTLGFLLEDGSLDCYEVASDDISGFQELCFNGPQDRSSSPGIIHASKRVEESSCEGECACWGEGERVLLLQKKSDVNCHFDDMVNLAKGLRSRKATTADEEAAGSERSRATSDSFNDDVLPSTSLIKDHAASCEDECSKSEECALNSLFDREPGTWYWSVPVFSVNDSSEIKVTTKVYIQGICCSSELPKVEKVLASLRGIDDYQVSVITKSAVIRHDYAIVTPDKIASALSKSGLAASVMSTKFPNGLNATTATAKAVRDKESMRAGSGTREMALPKWNILLGTVLWIASMASYVSSPDWLEYLKYCAIGTIVLSLPPIAKRAWQSLRLRVLDVNMLMSIAAIGACAIQDYVEGAAILCLFSLSDWIQLRATARARNAVASIIALQPETATLEESGEEVSVESVDVGSLIAVRPGDKIALDGVVQRGESSVDESNLTGESKPVRKMAGDNLSAGTMNIGGGYMVVRTTASASNSTVARLVKLVELASAQRSPTEQLVQTVAKYYTPIIVLLAALLATIPWFWGSETGLKYAYTALTLVVVAPCALVISTPTTYVCALARAANSGILIKGGKHLEALGRVGAIAFDKTGTLTEGAFKVQHLEILPLPSPTGATLGMQRILHLTYAVEKMSSHPIAVAACESIEAMADGVEGVTATMDISGFITVPGEGLEAEIDGRMVRVGNARMLDRLGLVLPNDVSAAQDGWKREGCTVAFIVIGDSLCGMFAAADAARPTSAAAVHRLRSIGVHTVMLTGDNAITAAKVGSQVGVDDVKSRLLPEGQGWRS